MNIELMEALNILEKEKDISKDTLLGAIEQSLLLACKNHFGTADNVNVYINPETCDFHVYAEKEVVEQVEDPVMEISLAEAHKRSGSIQVGDTVRVEIKSKEFGRIATQNAKNVILQKIREEERKVLFDQYYSKEKDVVTGIVQRYFGKHVSVNLGKVDAILTEGEQIKGERFNPTERIKVYIVAVKDTTKGPKILVSRTHPELVKRLFESEVTEVREGIVEIKSIAREAGSRSKIAVWSNDPDVDPVGACVGMNGSRVNAIVEELRGEKIDIINWSENPALLIENALSPAKVIAVYADPDEKTALVVVPDYQLSLAIGREGQNARLAAHLTGFKIDIKSETQAKESGELYDYEDEEYDGFDESGDIDAGELEEEDLGEEIAAQGWEEDEPETETTAEPLGEDEPETETTAELLGEDEPETKITAELLGEDEPETEITAETLGEDEAEAETITESADDDGTEMEAAEAAQEDIGEAEPSPEAAAGSLEIENDENGARLTETEEEPSQEIEGEAASSAKARYEAEAREVAAQIYAEGEEENYEEEVEGFYAEGAGEPELSYADDLDDDEDDEDDVYDPESDFADLAFLELDEGEF